MRVAEAFLSLHANDFLVSAGFDEEGPTIGGPGVLRRGVDGCLHRFVLGVARRRHNGIRRRFARLNRQRTECDGARGSKGNAEGAMFHGKSLIDPDA